MRPPIRYSLSSATVKEHEATGTDILGRDVHVLATGSNISASVSGLPPVPVNSIITLLSQQCTAPLHTRARTYTPRLQQMKLLIFSTARTITTNNSICTALCGPKMKSLYKMQNCRRMQFQSNTAHCKQVITCIFHSTKLK